LIFLGPFFFLRLFYEKNLSHGTASASPSGLHTPPSFPGAPPFPLLSSRDSSNFQSYCSRFFFQPSTFLIVLSVPFIFPPLDGWPGFFGLLTMLFFAPALGVDLYHFCGLIPFGGIEDATVPLTLFSHPFPSRDLSILPPFLFVCFLFLRWILLSFVTVVVLFVFPSISPKNRRLR